MLRRLFSSGNGTEAVQVELRGYDLEQADEIALQIEQRMSQMEGVAGVRRSRQDGRPEQNITFDREKIANLGLSVQDVARTVQTSIGGSRAGQFRVGGDEYPIVVRLRPKDRLTTQDLDAISVRTRSGETIPVSTLVKSERGRAPTSIQRVSGQRVTYVSANLEEGVALGDASNASGRTWLRWPCPMASRSRSAGSTKSSRRHSATFYWPS